MEGRKGTKISSDGKKKRVLHSKKKKCKKGEEEQGERQSGGEWDSPLCMPLSPQFSGAEMGFLEMMTQEDLQSLQEGRYYNKDPLLRGVAQEQRSFTNSTSFTSSASFQLASSDSSSLTQFPSFPTPTMPPLEAPIFPPSPPPSIQRKNEVSVEDEFASLECLQKIMDHFSDLQQVMRRKVEIQRSLVKLFDETNHQFSKIDAKLGSYANAVTQELVRQKEDFGVFADRLEGLSCTLGQITAKKSLRHKDFPQVQVAFYQIEAAFRLKRTQNLAIRSYSLPPKENHEERGGRRKGEERGEEGEEGEEAIEFLPKWDGSPKGFLSMLGDSNPEHLDLDLDLSQTSVSVTPCPPNTSFPPSASLPVQRQNTTSPHSSHSPPTPHFLTPQMPSQKTSPSSLSPSLSPSPSPQNIFSASLPSSAITVPPRISYHPNAFPLTPSSSFLAHSPPLGASVSAESLKDGKLETGKLLRKNKDSPIKKDVKTPRRDKKAMKINILRKDTGRGAMDKKPPSPSMERRDLKTPDYSAHRLSLRVNPTKEIENHHEKTPDFTAISLPDLLFYILEIAPVTSGYRRNFLATFTLFCTSEEVIEFLTDYLGGVGTDEEGIKKRTLGVILFVKRWIEGRFDTLKEESVLRALQNLISKITTLQPLVSATLERILSQQMTNQPIAELKNQKQFDCIDLTWDKFDVVGVCESICFEEFLLYQQITVDELLNWNSSKKREEKCPNIRAICNFSNHLATWVSTEIVKRAKLSERGFLLKKFVGMAELMLEMNNFSSCMSILGGLNSSPIARLKNTWKEAGKDILEQFERIDSLMSFRGSYATYREYLKGVVPPCLPFLGMYLTDLTFVSDGNVSPVDHNLINFSKWEMMAEILQNVKHFQQFQYPPPTQMNKCLEGFENYQGLNEDELYDYSTFVEPKGGSDDQSNEHLIAKYQEVQNRLHKALQEIELLKSQGKVIEREEGEEGEGERGEEKEGEGEEENKKDGGREEMREDEEGEQGKGKRKKGEEEGQT